MASPRWELSECDKEFFALELESFLPDRLFDAHMHVDARSDYSQFHWDLVAETPEMADAARYQSELHWIAPGRELAGATVIPTTVSGKDWQRGNAFAAEQAAKLPGGLCAMISPPTISAEELHQVVETHQAVALKPYHLMVQREDTLHAPLSEYLPDHLAAVAHEANLAVIVHLVCDTALADESNQRDIRRLCREFPNMKMVLAHSARGFNPSHVVRGIEAVAGLDNLFFDLSSACESGAISALLRVYGPSRMMWGSDYVFSHMHGRCVAVADTFAWLYACYMAEGPRPVDPNMQYVLAGLETLRAVKIACFVMGLTDSQVQAVFCDNAKQVFRRS